MSHARETLSLFLRQKQIQIPESGVTPELQRALSLLAGNNEKWGDFFPVFLIKVSLLNCLISNYRDWSREWHAEQGPRNISAIFCNYILLVTMETSGNSIFGFGSWAAGSAPEKIFLFSSSSSPRDWPFSPEPHISLYIPPSVKPTEVWICVQVLAWRMLNPSKAQDAEY